MLLFTQHITSRLQYTTEFISSIINQSIAITTDIDLFKNATDTKINYSNVMIENSYSIQPKDLLFSTNITLQNIEIFTCRNNTCFFVNTNDSSGFDVLACIFFVLSRYEEYLPHTLDEYGRYAHTNSIAFKQNFLHIPLVNFWVIDLEKQLKKYYPNYNIIPNNFKYVPTYDVDIAYAYKHKSIVANIGSFLKDFLAIDFDKIIEKANVFSGNQADPFDTYSWLQNLHRKYTLQPIYFFLLAEKKDKYDKNISPNNVGLQSLIKEIASNSAVGIHPSWQSEDTDVCLQQEVATLQKITAKQVTKSRQHYIRFSLPNTYKNLIDIGITEDYSMGYGSINGFRASVASPFFWYNLQEEKTTNLVVHPFCFMDANAFFEQHLSASAALEELTNYLTIVQQVNGQLITIFHNHFITTQPQWIAWRNMYQQFLSNNF